MFLSQFKLTCVYCNVRCARLIIIGCRLAFPPPSFSFPSQELPSPSTPYHSYECTTTTISITSTITITASV